MTENPRKIRHTTPARAAAARANGARGGRPKAKLPEESIARLGPPPTDDPFALVRWHAACLAEVQWLAMRGEIGSDLASSLRAGAGTAARLLPPDIVAALHRELDDRDDDIKKDTLGPPLEPVDPTLPDVSVRRSAR